MYANIIIDISHEKVDKTFQYRIPEKLEGQIRAGTQVEIPFGAGNRLRRGYVVGLTDRAEFDTARIKSISGVVPGSVTAESRLIRLAWWMKERYGSTMNQALKTVLPVKQKVRQKQVRSVCRLMTAQETREAAEEAGRRHHRARERLLLALSDAPRLPYEVVTNQMHLSPASLKLMAEKGLIAL